MVASAVSRVRLPTRERIALTVEDEKRALRRSMRARRASLPPERRLNLSRAACAHLVRQLHAVGRSPVALFASLPDEIDTASAVEAIAAHDGFLLLPRVVAPGQPLAFHRWSPGDALSDGRFGVREPLATAPVDTPAVVVAPLLAIDGQGYRLGYGGGFYDRSLRSLDEGGASTVSVGVGFAMQRVTRVPRGPFDRPVASFVDETGVQSFGPGEPTADDGIEETRA